jgi:hypothetical protein
VSEHNHFQQEFSGYATNLATVYDPGAGGTFTVKVSGGVATIYTGGTRRVPTVARGVRLDVFAVDSPVAITTTSDVLVATVAAGQVGHFVSAGETGWIVATDTRLLGFTDFSLYGTADDEEYDNNAALEQAVADGAKSIFFPAGDWHFTGPIDLTDPSFDNIRFFGAGSEFAAQHQEEGSGSPTGDEQLTRFVLHLDDNDSIWWDHQRAYRFGILHFCDICFQVTEAGSVFSFGDFTDTDPAAATMRGLTFERCYGTFTNYVSPHLTDQNPHGYTINRTNTNYFLRVHAGYDVILRDVAARGFYTNFILEHCDRTVLDNVRGITCYKHIHAYSIPGATQVTVGGHADNIYCETPFLQGCYFESMQVGKIRMETGYSDLVVDAGLFALPAAVTWTITAGDDQIIFDDWTGGFDATDYFDVRSVIRVQPDDAAEPYRDLLIDEVEANAITFRNASSLSYIHRTITGIGTDITRYYPQSVVVAGPRVEVTSPSLGINTATADLPHLWIVPSTVPVKMFANCESKGPSNIDPIPVVVASCAGVANGLQAGVDYFGSNDCPNHPLVNRAGLGPGFDGDWREEIFDEATSAQIFMPGRGVSSSNNVARDLMFYPITRDGRTVWCYRPEDAAIGWEIFTRRSTVDTVWTVHCYAPAGTETLSLFGGAGSPDTSALSAGWNVKTGTLTATTQMLGNAIRIGGLDYFVHKVIIQQYPASA